MGMKARHVFVYIESIPVATLSIVFSVIEFFFDQKRKKTKHAIDRPESNSDRSCDTKPPAPLFHQDDSPNTLNIKLYNVQGPIVAPDNAPLLTGTSIKGDPILIPKIRANNRLILA